MPPKKKVAGDAGKGEKIFKNLCAACHSHAVSQLNSLYRLVFLKIFENKTRLIASLHFVLGLI